jgi:hypothetical protein
MDNVSFSVQLKDQIPLNSINLDLIGIEILNGTQWSPVNFINLYELDSDLIFQINLFSLIQMNLIQNLTLSFRVFYNGDNIFYVSYSDKYCVNLTNWIQDLYQFSDYTIDLMNYYLILNLNSKIYIYDNSTSLLFNQIQTYIQIQIDNQIYFLNSSLNPYNNTITVSIANISSILIKAINSNENICIFAQFLLFNQLFQKCEFILIVNNNSKAPINFQNLLYPLILVPALVFVSWSIKMRKRKVSVSMDLVKFSI